MNLTPIAAALALALCSCAVQDRTPAQKEELDNDELCRLGVAGESGCFGAGRDALSDGSWRPLDRHNALSQDYFQRSCDLGFANGCFAASETASRSPQWEEKESARQKLLVRACELADVDETYLLHRSHPHRLLPSFPTTLRKLACKELGKTYFRDHKVRDEPKKAKTAFARACSSSTQKESCRRELDELHALLPRLRDQCNELRFDRPSEAAVQACAALAELSHPSARPELYKSVCYNLGEPFTDERPCLKVAPFIAPRSPLIAPERPTASAKEDDSEPLLVHLAYPGDSPDETFLYGSAWTVDWFRMRAVLQTALPTLSRCYANHHGDKPPAHALLEFEVARVHRARNVQVHFPTNTQPDRELGECIKTAIKDLTFGKGTANAYQLLRFDPAPSRE